jgi:hypothetical protein
MAFFARAISLTQHLSAATPKSSSSVSPAKTLKIFYNNIATASSNNSSFAPHNLHLVWLIVNSTSSTSVNRPSYQNPPISFCTRKDGPTNLGVCLSSPITIVYYCNCIYLFYCSTILLMNMSLRSLVLWLASSNCRR